MPNPNSRIATGYRVVRLADFSKGENRKSSEFSLSGGYLASVLNFYLSQDGTLIGRRGTRRWNNVSLGSGPPRGQVRAYARPDLGAPLDDQFWLAMHGITVWLGDDATKTFAASRSGLDPTAQMWFLQVGKYVFASNGVDSHAKLDVNTQLWTPWGLNPPDVAPTLAAGAAGVPNGSYTAKITFLLESGAESEGGPVSTTVAVVNQQIDVSAIQIGPTGTAKRRVYLFKSNVSSVYQLAAEISNNTATTVSINTDQDAWTTTIPTDNEQDPPPPGAWISAYHKNRIWVVGDKSDKLYFSKVGVPANALEAFPSTNSLVIQFQGGDYGTALMPMGDVLYVFGHESVHYATGDDPLNFKPIKTFATAGAPGPWAVDRIHIPGTGAVCTYLSRNGVMIIQGREAMPISDAESPFFTDLPEVS